MVKDLTELEKQLLDELRRFKHIALTSSDPMVKPQLISKLFVSKSTQSSRDSALAASSAAAAAANIEVNTVLNTKNIEH